MATLGKACSLALALGFLLLAVNPANAQQGGVISSNEKVVSMNGLSSDRSYIVNLSWQPNGTKANIFDIFIDDSRTSARLTNVRYDIALYSEEELVASSMRTGQTTTRQLYNFEDLGQYTVRVSNIEGSDEYVDFSIQVTPEFPLHVLAALAAVFAGMIALRRFRPAA